MAITVRQSGGDYNNLKDALADTDNIINIDQTWTVNDNFTGTLSITVATTITCSGGAETIGRPHEGSETTYRVRKTDAGHMFTVTANLTLVGLDAQNESTTSSDEGFRVNDDIDFTFTDCVLGMETVNASQNVIFYAGSSGTLAWIFTNCVFYNANAESIKMNSDVPNPCTIKFVFCHFINNGAGTGGGHSLRLRFGTACTIRALGLLTDGASGGAEPFISNGADSHVLIIDQSIADATGWAANANFTETITNSDLSRTWTDNASPGEGNFVIIEDATTSPFDVRLKDNITDNDAQGKVTGDGAGLSVPATDIVGTTRPQGTNSDAGVFEVVVAAGDIAPILAVRKVNILKPLLVM